MQVQVSTYAAAAKRARSKQRRAELLDDLHFYQRQFDEMNDAIAPRYKIEPQDRSHHPDASRSGELATEMGIIRPGQPTPMKTPGEILRMLDNQSDKRCAIVSLVQRRARPSFVMTRATRFSQTPGADSVRFLS